jgi:hypothetical protein
MRPKKKDPLLELFKQLKPLLQNYVPPLTAKKDSDTGYEVWGTKQAMIAGKMKSEIFFAAFMVQKSFIGFYYFPIYTHPEIKKDLPPRLVKLLSGKSCFHIAEVDENLMQDIETALAFGFEFYTKQGWI